MAVIEVHELHKRYGDTVALDGIDLKVRAGEVFGLLGPNGGRPGSRCRPASRRCWS